MLQVPEREKGDVIKKFLAVLCVLGKTQHLWIDHRSTDLSI